MTVTSKPKRMSLLSHGALGLALALGTMAGSAMVATPALAAKAPKFKFSDAFKVAAAPLEKAITDAPKRPEVIAADAKVTAADQALSNARGKTQREQASAALDAAMAELGAALASEKALMESSFAAVVNEDDRFMAGNMALSLGGIARDQGIQRRGLQAILQSGKAAPADVPKFNFYVGRFSYVLKDYATAIPALQQAIAGGYFENNAEIMLVEAMAASGQPQEALATLRTSVDRMTAAGGKVPETWYSRGYQIAYKAKIPAAVNEWAAEAVKAYPTPFNWLGAFQLAREMHGSEFTTQEDIDLGRLEKRSGALTSSPQQNGREYINFMQAAESRQLWAELTAFANEAISVGALTRSDPFVAEKLAMAAAKLPADQRVMAEMKRDAPTAPSALTAFGAGDKLLSGGDAVQAEAMFQIALTKTGGDRDRILTRLGVAQLDQGKFAEAKASFLQVTGPRATLARLGAILADTKAAAAAVPTAPVTP